jgi:hypothetical protein
MWRAARALIPCDYTTFRGASSPDEISNSLNHIKGFVCPLPSVESEKICQRLLVGWSSKFRGLLAWTSVRVRALRLEVS